MADFKALSFDDLIPGQAPKKKTAKELSFDDIIAARRDAMGRPPQEQPDPNLSETFPAGHAQLIGAGRTLDKVAEGNRQLGINALIAGKEALGLPTAEEFATLNQQAAVEKSKDEAYRGLQQRHPLSTGMGEALPLAPLPVGQVTATGRVLAPAVAYGAAGAAEYGSPQQRAVRGGANFVSGLVGGATGEVLARTINPVRGAMGTPAQEAARAAAEKISAPLLPSQMTGSQTLARIEDSLARAPFSADVMGDFVGKQKQAVGRAASRAIGETAEEAPTQVVQDAAKQALGQKYKDMRSQIPNGLPATQTIFDAVDRSIGMLSKGSLKAEGKGEALALLNELKDKLYTTKALTPEEYSSWVSDLSSVARGSKNETIKAALKSVGGTMDREARGPLHKDWQKVDQAYAALKTLQKSGAVNPQTGEIAEGRLASYMRRHPSGADATELANVKAFGEAVPQLRAGSPTFDRGEVGMSGLLNALWRYPTAKALTSGAGRDYLSKGLLGSPEASRIGALMGQSGALPLSTGAVNLGLLNFLLSQ